LLAADLQSAARLLDCLWRLYRNSGATVPQIQQERSVIY
jgi:hypothetical protein